jgi:hypothetical protein
MTALTPETVRATRQGFADNALACIEDARTGVTRVNNVEDYAAWQSRCAREALAGECPALLP